jgi:sialate O-acetylesterase
MKNYFNKLKLNQMKVWAAVFIALSVFIAPSKWAKAQALKLPSIFQSGMVLQQNREDPVWGWAEPGAAITIHPSWELKTYRTKADSRGKWMAKIAAPNAGGPYKLTIHADTTTIVFSNVLVGEVWVASGQSNMEMPVKGYFNTPVLHSDEIITDSKNKWIRLFKVHHNTSTKPQKNFKGNWAQAQPASVADFSVAGYIFGRKLQRVLGVPVGIIQSTWGGTSVQSWTDGKTLQKFGIDLNKLNNVGGLNKRYKGKKAPKRHPGVLYNAMIAPMIPYGIRGAIWYQGERDRRAPELYGKIFPAMIKSWRKKWNEGAFPFYFVQIAPYDYGKKVNSAYLREAQLKTMQKVPNTGMAVTLDIGTKHPIHPPYKIKVGDRLAYWALAKTYGIHGIAYSGPIYKSMKVKNGKAYLQFSHAPMGLTTFGDSLTHFTIAGADKKFYPAKTKITRKGIVVWSKQVSHPAAVRYGWKNWLIGHLFNTYGLPAPSFRTDDW